MNFEEYNKWITETSWPGKTPLPKKLAEEVIEVVVAASSLNAVLDTPWYGDYLEELRLELGDSLCLLCLVADKYGLSMREIWEANKEKLENRAKYGKGNHGKRS